MIMYATAQIDVTRPTGRRLVRELERHTKIVKVDYPLPVGVSEKGYTISEVREMGYNKLSEHYGVDVRKL
jgi:hypothetical protein